MRLGDAGGLAASLEVLSRLCDMQFTRLAVKWQYSEVMRSVPASLDDSWLPQLPRDVRSGARHSMRARCVLMGCAT